MSKTNKENTQQPSDAIADGNTQPIQAIHPVVESISEETVALPVKKTRQRKAKSNPADSIEASAATVPVKVSAGKIELSEQQPLNISADETVVVQTNPEKKRRAAAVKPSVLDDATIPVAPSRKAKTQTAPLPNASTSDESNYAAGLTVPPPDMGQSTNIEPPVKSKRTKFILLGVLGMIILIMLGAGVGYASAIRARMVEEKNQILVVASTQFELGLADQREGRLETARKRYEYVLSIYPDFPGVTEKLVEVGLAIGETQTGQVVETEIPQEEIPVVTPVATKDTTSVSILFNQANNQLNAKDWDGLFTTIEKMRYIDPEYEPVKTDGKLYMALRNRGITQIQAGNLEPGLFSFAMATQIAPIDEQAESYATWARMYLKAASFGLVDEFLGESVRLFSELHAMVPNLRDSSGITVSQRYAQALVNLGLYLQRNQDYCGAVPLFQQASGIFPLPSLAQLIPQAEEYCNNPPETATSMPENQEAPAVEVTEEPTPNP